MLKKISIIIFILFAIPAYADLELDAFINNLEDNFGTEEDAPIIIRESPYSFDKTVANLKKAISGRNFKLIRVQHLDQNFVKKENESKDLLVYFCNFKLVDEAIRNDKRVGQFLPCRITVLERNKQVYLVSVNPKTTGKLLSNTSLRSICNQMLEMYMDIFDEVTI